MGNGTDYFKNKYNTNERPGESYNMFASLAAGIPSVVMGVDAYMKRNEARDNLKTQQGYVDTLMKNYMETPIYNPYDNLSVATQANQIKMEETDKALANTLDTLRAQGASAGGATALAQAALRSKAGIAADIEKQEVGNERLKAQGEIMVQNAEMQRRGQQMDYEQSKADQLRMEQFAYGERAADMAGALGSLGLQAARGLGSGKNKTSDTVDPTVDPTVDTTESNFVENDQYSPNFIPNPDMDTLEIADPPPMYQEKDAFGNVVRPVEYNFLQDPGMPSFDPSFGNPNRQRMDYVYDQLNQAKLNNMSDEEFKRQYLGNKFYK